jgi:hypothetical protein
VGGGWRRSSLGRGSFGFDDDKTRGEPREEFMSYGDEDDWYACAAAADCRPASFFGGREGATSGLGMANNLATIRGGI